MQHIGSGMWCNLINASTGMQAAFKDIEEHSEGRNGMCPWFQQYELPSCPRQPNCRAILFGLVGTVSHQFLL